MKIAVSGASGFLGRYLVAELERRSVSPIIVCRPSSSIPPEWAMHSIARLDVESCSGRSFEEIGAPDLLIHLAWGGLPAYGSMHHCEHELPVHYACLKHLIEGGLKNLLVSGTCFEYGMQSGELTETLATDPCTAYGVAKDGLRRQLQLLQRTRSFGLTWARLFYVFGRGQSKTSLYSQLEQAVARGDRSFAMSGGEQLRDYLPIEAAARGIASLALNGRENRIVNVCSGTPISIRRLVEGWIEQNGWPIVPLLGRHPYPDHEPFAFWGDARKFNAIVK